jgi:hypothetical protein
MRVPVGTRLWAVPQPLKSRGPHSPKKRYPLPNRFVNRHRCHLTRRIRMVKRRTRNDWPDMAKRRWRLPNERLQDRTQWLPVHEKRAELEASEVGSVQGQMGIRVLHKATLPLNLGRNLFPLRRFSYPTRVSRFNGTA